MSSTRTGVMLSYPADEKRLSRLPEEVIFQRKYNGERCRIEWKDGKPILYSSCGNIMPFFTQIKNELQELGLQGVNFDGELYCHEMPREEIHSIASRRTNPHPDEKLLSLQVFDIVDNNLSQLSRIVTLNGRYFLGDYVVKVESILDNKDKLIYFADQFIKEGYEGVIIRNPQGEYTPRKTNLMLKFKPTETDTYPIVNYQEEIDIYGFSKGRLGSVTVQDSDGCIFSVGTGNALNASGRSYWWQHRDNLIGKYAVVKHSSITTVNGFPTCTSLLSIEIANKNNEKEIK